MERTPNKLYNNVHGNSHSFPLKYPQDYILNNLYSSSSISCSCVIPKEVNDILPSGCKEQLKGIAIFPVQTHSLNVRVLKGDNDDFTDTDALVTFIPGIRIGVLTADCVPILLYAPDIQGIAAIHAGWKGTLGGIVDKVLDCLESYGADPTGIVAIFGPSISMKAYEVDEELACRFSDEGFNDCIYHPDGLRLKPHIDLQAVNIKRLCKRHLRPDNIHPNSDCTLLTLSGNDGVPKYPSYRRNGTGLRILTTIILNVDNKQKAI